MRFSIWRVSDTANKPCDGAEKAAGAGWEIEISTLEEILALSDEGCHGLIVNRVPARAKKSRLPELIIYDDHIE